MGVVDAKRGCEILATEIDRYRRVSADGRDDACQYGKDSFHDMILIYYVFSVVIQIYHNILEYNFSIFA